MAMGRPPKDDSEKKAYSLKIRFSPEQERKLNKCVEHYGIKKTEVMLTGLEMMYDDIEKKNNG